MSIKESQLQELAWLYFYFRKSYGKPVSIQSLYNELTKAKFDIDKNELVSDLESLRDEGYIDATDTLWSQQDKSNEEQELPGLYIRNIQSIGKRFIEDPFFYYNIYTNNTTNIAINTVQGNNNVSNISQSISNISDEKINQIEKQINEIQASLEINNKEFKKYFDDLRKQLKQKNKERTENEIKKIFDFGFHTINNANVFISFILGIHSLLRLLH